MQVSSFQVDGSTLLSPARIQAILAPYQGASSMPQLQSAVQALQAAYRSAGYGGVVAWLPQQQVNSGVVSIAVREGHLAHIVVIGNQRVTTAEVLAMLPDLRVGVTPRVRSIDAEVQFANRNPAHQLGVVLEEGEQPGEIDARVTVSESAAQQWSLFVDNTGTPATGVLRTGVNYFNQAVGATDQQLQISAQTAPQHLDNVFIGSANWRVPLYGYGTTLSSYAVYSNVGGVNTATAAGSAQFSGRGKVLGFNLDHQLERWREFDQHAYVGLDWRQYENACNVGDLGQAACGSAGASVAVLPVSIGYALQREGVVPQGLQADLAENVATSMHDASSANFSAARAGSSSRFGSGHTVIFGGWVLPQDWRLQWRLNAQVADGPLVDGEQFGLAGTDMVRGYEEREVTGDQGLAERLELTGPNLLSHLETAGLGLLRPAAFFDSGRVWNRDGQPCSNGDASACTLAAFGLGLRGQHSSAFQWHLDLTRALEPGHATARGGMRAQFRLAYSL